MLQGMTLGETIGQALGIFAVLLGFISFQARTRKMLLLTQCAISVVFIAHYLLIGATSGLAMNIVSLGRNLTYYYQEKLPLSQKQTTVLYMALYLLLGALAWQDWYSLMPMISLIINTYFYVQGRPAACAQEHPCIFADHDCVRCAGGVLRRYHVRIRHHHLLADRRAALPPKRLTNAVRLS